MIHGAHLPGPCPLLQESLRNPTSMCGLSEGLKVEVELSMLLRITEDRMKGARAFQEQRSPPFKGRQSSSPPGAPENAMDQMNKRERVGEQA